MDGYADVIISLGLSGVFLWMQTVTSEAIVQN